MLFTILRQMVHEELALRRNKARFHGADANDQFIEKVEISEPEFAKKVNGFVFVLLEVYLILVLFPSGAST